MSKKTFAAVVAPNLAPTTAPQAKAIAADTSLGTLTVADLTSIIAGVLAQTKAPKASKTAVSVAVPAPVVSINSKPEPKEKSIGFFSTGKVAMLTCPDGVFGTSTTVSPANGGTFQVAFPERATMKDGVAVKLPAEVRSYVAKTWQRNSKNTGWISLFPKKA